MENEKKISDDSPENLFKKVPIIVSTFHGVRIFQLRILLDLSCTRCLWSDMFLTEHEYFRYLIKRKHLLKMANSDVFWRATNSPQNFELMSCSQCSSAPLELRESVVRRRRAWESLCTRTVDLHDTRSKRPREIESSCQLLAASNSRHRLSSLPRHTRLLVFAFFPTVFEEKRDCSQSTHHRKALLMSDPIEKVHASGHGVRNVFNAERPFLSFSQVDRFSAYNSAQ